MQARERLIIALDVANRTRVEQLVEQLRDWVGMFKVGLEPFCNFGPDLVRGITSRGGRVFLDLKFHDIPRTVAQVGRAAVRLGVDLFNVHVAGGREMLRAVVDAVRDEAGGGKAPGILGVTLLTSLGADQLQQEIGVARSPLDQVLFWAELARECGLDGVVASPREVAAIRSRCGRDFLIVTPGIRPVGAIPDDQVRTATPAAALRAGADYLVVGRPVVKAAHPLQAVRELLQEMEEVQ